MDVSYFDFERVCFYISVDKMVIVYFFYVNLFIIFFIFYFYNRIFVIFDLDCSLLFVVVFFDLVCEIVGDWGFDNMLFNIDFFVFYIVDFLKGIR